MCKTLAGFRLVPSLLATFFLAACGGGGSPSIVADSNPQTDTDHIQQPDLEVEVVCQDDCDGKECGDDGCGGICGDCSEGSICDEVGLCIAAACESSKDCPGDLVCADDVGFCVDCVSAADCAEGETCGPDHKCHPVVACTSDKDCKEHDMVCDQGAGVCVECLKAADCPDEEHCEGSYCVPDVCLAGATQCDGEMVQVCIEDGSSWEVGEICGAGWYCEDGACLEQVCPPGETFCEGEVATSCDEAGTLSEEDCAAQGLHCFDGACLETVCEPGIKFCEDDATTAECADDGMDFTTETCPAEHYCGDGECLPWICPAGKVYCDGDTAVSCDTAGSSIVTQVDCTATDQICVEGECLSLACAPGTVFCVDDFTAAVCDDAGLNFEATDCAAEAYCLAGECVPWVCTPGEPTCNGSVATLCNNTGSGPQGGGEDCAESAKKCESGQCVQCFPSCFGKNCGDDGCGGSCGECVDSDPCTENACSDSTFTCEFEPIPECCEQDADCDNDDLCTTDWCEESECVHLQMDCDDGNSCTLDGCSTGTCYNFPLEDPSCCPHVQTFENFELGSAWGWTSDNGNAFLNISDYEGWAHTGKWFLKLDKGGSVNLPVHELPVAPGATMSFWLKTYNWNVGNCDNNRLWVEVNNSLAAEVCDVGDEWTLVEVDLSPWLGQAVHVRFHHVGSSSPTKYLLMDDLLISSACCAGDSGCNDGLPCTEDSCGQAGGCTNTPIEGCCKPELFTEDFELGSAWGWTNDNGSAFENVNDLEGWAHTGEWFLKLDKSGSVNLPVHELPVAPDATLSFWLKTYNWNVGNCDNNRLWVEVNNSVAAEICDVGDEWTLVEVDLSFWLDETVYVRLHHVGSSSPTKYLLIDDVLISSACCAGDSGCNDGNPCTEDSCGQAGGCTNTPIEGCCKPELFTEDFELGSAWGWTNDNGSAFENVNDLEGWAHTGEWFLKLDKSGSVNLPIHELPVAPDATLSFWLKTYNWNVGNCDNNRLWVEVNNSVAAEICDVGDEWTLVEVDLSPWLGQAVHVRFHHVGSSSQTKYLLMDDLLISSACCAGDSGCNDGNPCTADSCGQVGGCINSPLEGCCKSELLTENFELGTAWGWTYDNGDPVESIYDYDDWAHTGEWFLKINKSGSVNLPAQQLPVAPGAQLTFWMRTNNWLVGNCQNNRLLVEVNNSIAGEICDVEDEWALVEVDLAPWIGQTIHVRLHHISNSGSSPYVVVDDVLTAATCCSTDAGCDDGDPCTADSCAQAGGCINSPLEGCCKSELLTENFELGTAWGWTYDNGDPVESIYDYDDWAHTGEWFLKINKSGSVNLPAQQLPVAPGAQLTFWMRTNNWLVGNCQNNRLLVEVNNSIAGEICDVEDEWALVEVDLAPWSGQTIHVRLHHISSSGSSPYVVLDDVLLLVQCE